MTLPRLTAPEFETVIPSSKEKIKFRPFLMREEKILYMALEGGDQKEIFNSVMRMLESCILTPGIEYTKFTSYDLEYLFLKLRAKSVGEQINVSLKHSCGASTKVSINIEDISIQYNESHQNKIDLGGGIGIKFVDPKAAFLQEVEIGSNEIDQMMSLIYNCIELVYDENDVYEDFTQEELLEFIENLSKDQFEKIMQFFNTLPKLSHEVSYKCSGCGEKETVVLEGLQSFFT
jgi:hypothetical protein